MSINYHDSFPSELDSDYDCVPIGSQTADGVIASPPPGGSEAEDKKLCPEGYVPVRHRRDYSLEGKVIIHKDEPEQNPTQQESDTSDG